MNERSLGGEVLLKFNEACKYLRVSSATLYRFMDTGKIKGYKVGSTWRFYKGDVKKLVSDGKSTEDAGENEKS
jgi:excisionase family DNA binding protein